MPARVRLVALVVVGLAGACGRRPDRAPPGTTIRVNAPTLREKPAAPARLALATRPRPDGTVRVELTATPTRAVDALELVLAAGPTPTRARFGPTPAGTPRVLALTVAPAVAATARGAVRTHVGAATRLRLVAAEAPAARLAVPRAVVDVPGVGRVAEVLP